MRGNRLKILREEKGLKQDELANLLSISPSAVGMYERNEREPNDDLTIKFAEFFGVSTDYLLGKSEIRNPEQIPLTDEDIKFMKSIKKLDETNKMIIRNTMEALLDKQEKDENKEN